MFPDVNAGSFWLGFTIGALLILLCATAAFYKVYRELAIMDRERKALENTEPAPVCGCKHHRSFHDDDGCHYTSSNHYDKKLECGCKVYIGPPALELME